MRCFQVKSIELGPSTGSWPPKWLFTFEPKCFRNDMVMLVKIVKIDIFIFGTPVLNQMAQSRRKQSENWKRLQKKFRVSMATFARRWYAPHNLAKVNNSEIERITEMDIKKRLPQTSYSYHSGPVFKWSQKMSKN